MAAIRKHHRSAVAQLEALGFTFTRRAKHALLFDHPCGARASLPGTPSDHRTYRNALAEARRAVNQKEMTH